MNSASRELTLDRWAQDPAFASVQAASRRRWPEQWKTIEIEMIAAASELGEFSADDVMDRVGRRSVPPNLIGSVLGSWRAMGRLRVVGRQKARHVAAKGRWMNRFSLVTEVT